MLYACILLGILIILLVLHSVFMSNALKKTVWQMDEIEKYPERNRQLKTLSTDCQIEKLQNKINLIYQARQWERILYQRREIQIRHEIENISHDLRTPLTSILGYVELLKDKDTSEAEKKEYLDIITKRARVLQGFITDFYEISRMEAEDYPLTIDRIGVQNMVREAAVSYYHEFEAKNIQVAIELEDKPCYIAADKIQFDRILNNLIQNALKYTKKQFIIRQFTAHNKCVLQFRNDRGEVTEEELKLIFDRFYTRDAARNQGSTGLGLTITKILVEKMKGSVEARFEDNEFVIELICPDNADFAETL